ncbi:MAG TPA: ferritin-like domain-containing protein [Kiloniellales bacterium]|nr:ferritin-like domain-containing protein [Kiloniellales bacterium]
MSDKHWSLDDIAWDRFDRSRVDPELLKIAKAAALVEFNSDDYAAYLCNVFPDDEDFQKEAWRWAKEEIQHGEVLGRWACLADPDFDFEGAVARFREGYRIPVESTTSVRGSRSGELVSRCIVEVGTSSYYGSIADTTEEPVFKEICQRIAADELRHYKLFYTYLRRYLEREKISRPRRLWIALGRVQETEDDELAYAYYAANAPLDEPYDRKRWSSAYMVRAYGYYKPLRVQRAAAMICKAAGLKPQGRMARLLAKLAYGTMQRRHRRLSAKLAN